MQFGHDIEGCIGSRSVKHTATIQVLAFFQLSLGIPAVATKLVRLLFTRLVRLKSGRFVCVVASVVFRGCHFEISPVLNVHNCRFKYINGFSRRDDEGSWIHWYHAVKQSKRKQWQYHHTL